MGEKIKDLGKLHIGNSDFLIELNEPAFVGDEKSIHIQNELLRYSISQSEFLRIATLVLKAKENLMSYKED